MPTTGEMAKGTNEIKFLRKRLLFCLVFSAQMYSIPSSLLFPLLPFLLPNFLLSPRGKSQGPVTAGRESGVPPSFLSEECYDFLCAHLHVLWGSPSSSPPPVNNWQDRALAPLLARATLALKWATGNRSGYEYEIMIPENMKFGFL